MEYLSVWCNFSFYTNVLLNNLLNAGNGNGVFVQHCPAAPVKELNIFLKLGSGGKKLYTYTLCTQMLYLSTIFFHCLLYRKYQTRQNTWSRSWRRWKMNV